LTAAKLKPLVFSVSGFALSNVSLSWISMTSACCLHSFVMKSYTYGMLKAVCNSQTGVGPWKIANGVENLVLQVLQFH
jgi:hypothetical protein